MVGNEKIRLIKIASEINIGKDTIVEYLNSKGFVIENKPTSILSEEMIDVVYEKFKREKKAAEKQREKIQKQKEMRKAADGKPKKTDEEYADGGDAIANEEHTTAEAPQEEIPAPKPIEEPEPPKQAEPVTPVVVDTAEEIKSAVEPEAVAPTEQTAFVSENKPEIPKEYKAKNDQKHFEKSTKKDEVIEIIPVDSNAPVALTKDQLFKGEDKPIDAIPQELIPVDDADLDVEDKPLIAPTEGIEDEGDDQSDARRDSRRRKKKKKLVEVTSPGETPQLKGLTIVGKIDLHKPKPENPLNKPGKKKRRPGFEDEGTSSIGDFASRNKKKKIKGKDKEISLDTPQGGAAQAGANRPNPTHAPNSNPNPNKPKDAAKPADRFEKAVDARPGDKPAGGADKDKKRKKRKKSIRESISQEDVEKAIRQTLAGMEIHGATGRAKLRQKKKAEREEKEMRIQEQAERDSKILKLTEFVTTSDLANLMNIAANEIILKCMSLGLMVTINQRLDKETIILIADDYGFDVEFIDEQETYEEEEEEDDEEDMVTRSPIVTIMGHVDHGKTSLLDFIRHSNVVMGEAGGITQHIGAYRVNMPSGRQITFLDTPGHEAFTAMRARGAQVTDIVVLVVAADDSVMPQTIEAISHARAANVPIIVAINKCDKPDANPDRIKQQLTDHGILVEDWGGKNQSVEISAKKGINIDLLLEKILLEADLLDLKANPDRNARGFVIESNMSKGLGAVATVIVQKGTLMIGDPFVSGIHSGKVRAMFDERGNKMEEAGPSTPVRVIGFDGLSEAGDNFFVAANDVEARNISTERKQLRREQDLRQVRHQTLDEISAQILIGGVKDLNLIIKGDVGGSVEAICDSLLKLSTEEVRVNILHKGVGNITESDVTLAAASNAVVIGFNVAPSAAARKVAENEAIDVRLYDIIYDCINEIHMALEGLLSPDIKEEITCEVEVRRVFKISRLGAIAGCYVLSGKITRNDKVRVLRNGLPVFTGGLDSLKRAKDDSKEVETGFECGIQLHGFNSFEEGDIIQGFKLIEVRRTLN